MKPFPPPPFRPQGRLGAWCLLALGLATLPVGAAPQAELALPRNRYRNGDETLRAFATVAAQTRDSIVKLNVDGETMALGTVVGTNGLVLTKASELKPGKLTAWLARGGEVEAALLTTDEEHDVALVRVPAPQLRPIQWTIEEVTLGQWAITPGIVEVPHAVGVISTLPRRIRPPRAFMGVQFDPISTEARIEQILPGLGAEAAGLRAGDVIQALNHIAVTNREHAVAIIRELRDGQAVAVRVLRGDQQINAEVRLKTPGPQDALSDAPASARTARLTGAVSQRAEGFESVIQHDAVLAPWLCGGPLVNLDGRAMGLNIARAGRVATYALPARTVRKILAELLARAGTPAPTPRP